MPGRFSLRHKGREPGSGGADATQGGRGEETAISLLFVFYLCNPCNPWLVSSFERSMVDGDDLG